MLRNKPLYLQQYLKGAYICIHSYHISNTVANAHRFSLQMDLMDPKEYKRAPLWHTGIIPAVTVMVYMVLYSTVTVFFLSAALRGLRTGCAFVCCCCCRVHTETSGGAEMFVGCPMLVPCLSCGQENELSVLLASERVWGRTRCFLWTSSWLLESKCEEEEEEGEEGSLDRKSKSFRSCVDSSSWSSLASEAERFISEGGVRPACLIRASISMAFCHVAGARACDSVELCVFSSCWL